MTMADKQESRLLKWARVWNVEERVKMRVMVVSGRGEGSLILLLEHNYQRANTLSGRHRLTKEKKGERDYLY